MTTDVLTIRGLHKRYRGRRGTLANDGIDAVAMPHLARRRVSVQAQANVPISGLTPRIAIELVGRIRGGSRDAVRRRTQHLLDGLDLGPWADTPSQKISGGIARLTAFAMTAVVPGALVILDEPTNILDEPTNDVDPVRRRLLWDQIRSLADDGGGVLLVTHNVHEAERVVDRLAILDQGRVLASGTPADLTAPLRGTLTVEIEVNDPNTPWYLAVTAVRTHRHRRVGTVPVDAAADVVTWATHLTEAGRIERFQLTPAALEDVYIDLVGHGEQVDGPTPPSSPDAVQEAAA